MKPTKYSPTLRKKPSTISMAIALLTKVLQDQPLVGVMILILAIFGTRLRSLKSFSGAGPLLVLAVVPGPAVTVERISTLSLQPPLKKLFLARVKILAWSV